MEQEVNVGEKILSTAEGGRQILSILETYIGYCKGEEEIKIITKYLNSIRATQENDGRSATHKAVAIGAASFAVTHSLASYLYARKELSKRLIGRAVSKKLVTRIGYVGDCLTIVESIFNVRQAFLEKNEMQAFAYMGATAAGAASLVFSVKGVSISLPAIMASGASGSSIALVVLKAVWPILVLAAISLVASWLAARYAFSPLVRFFANYLFNQVELKKLGLDYSQLTTEAIMQVIDAKKRSEERRVGKECRSGWWPYQ